MHKQRVTPSVITYSALISACEKDKQPEQALKVFEALMQQGVVPDEITYNALMQALAIPERMLEHGVALTVITYDALIIACEKGTRAQQALLIFQ